ncbi:hypothetical protein NQ317_008659 [Molorchus minor]|uniref:Uncharacterized protein n=1 Tax=Molorchus minor TaxID=1323400 RepID=A0ABQ9K1R9_9CUCU|nr:hypothetical protein NQ317_008659 [Molorchus minor]
MENKNQWGRLIACLPQLDSIDLVEPSLKLGRSDECDIIIHKSKFPQSQLFYISKEHFQIIKDPNDEYITYIIDLSKNGTYLNGTLIGRRHKVVLQNNDSITIGDKLQVYLFKSMICAVFENYLPASLKKRYEPSRLLGKGGCGEVRLVYEKPLIVNMKEIVETEEEVFIILEYVRGGELTHLISKSHPLTEATTKFLFYQMVLAVQYLHADGVTHRDLKPGNVLLMTNNSQSLIKVTDFGLSKVAEDYDMMRTVCGTWHYIAPEVLNPTIAEYDKQVDVWSLGVILFYMLSNELPFQSAEKAMLGKMIVRGLYNMSSPAWYEVSTDAKDLVKKMLVLNPRNRITVPEILNHPWIAKDNLMRFRVENLLTKVKEDNEKISTKKRILQEERIVTGGIKRIKLSKGCDS